MTTLKCNGKRKAVSPTHVNASEGFVETDLGVRLEPIASGIVLYAQMKNPDGWEPYDVDDLATFIGRDDHDENVALIGRMVERGCLMRVAKGAVCVTEHFLIAIKEYVE